MTTSTIISAPQFKKELIRTIGNIVPTCSVEFVSDQDRHLKFRLVDDAGRYRSNVISLIRNKDSLEKSTLVASIEGAGIPNGGLPRGF